MSSALAIGGAIEALRNLIDNGFVQANLAGAVGGAVTVSAIAPDLIHRDDPAEPPRLNLFLMQVLPNTGLRNDALPWHDAQGRRASNPPLALNLHVLLTAYARSDAVAEMLLGSAMLLLHETPRLTAGLLRALLDPTALPATLQALADTRLADQAELLRITLMNTSLDDTAKIWSALQTPCRPSASYEIGVLLLDSLKPTVQALPVLSRGLVDPATGRDRGVAVQADMGPPLPTLFSAAPLLTQQNVLRLGDTLHASGVHLAGSGATAVLSHNLRPQPIEVAVAPAADGKSFDLVLPADAAAQVDFIPGIWQLSLRVTPPGEAHPRTSNGVALLLCADPVLADTGPPLNLPAASAVRSAAPARVTVQLRTRPSVRAEQQAELVLGGQAAVAAPRAAAADPLVFVFDGQSLAAGPQWLRLRVDGVESPLVRKTGSSPVFDPSQRLTVP